MQAAGSAVSYARRYSLQSMLSMRAEDDDGESAVGRSKPSFSQKAAVAKADPVKSSEVKQEAKVDTKTESNESKPTGFKRPVKTDNGVAKSNGGF